MISIRKHIDGYFENRPERQMADSVASELCALFQAIGEATDRAIPSLGADVSQKMTGLQKTLDPPVTPEVLKQTNQLAQNELSQWADRACSHHAEVERELHEITSVVLKAAETVSQRDDKYVQEIGALTGRLSSPAESNDLLQVRRSIFESTRALKACVAQMAEESKSSVRQLTAQVTDYRTRLEEAERVSLTDPLTGLANRRAFEKHIERRIAGRHAFCLIMIDLNDFKSINDRYGHVAGDDLLRQFGGELKSQFGAVDLISRLGGDEFIVITPGGLHEAKDKVARIRRWTLGEYKLPAGDQKVKATLDAAIGIAAWDGSESGIALLARTDKEVYRAKEPRGHVLA